MSHEYIENLLKQVKEAKLRLQHAWDDVKQAQRIADEIELRANMDIQRAFKAVELAKALKQNNEVHKIAANLRAQ